MSFDQKRWDEWFAQQGEDIQLLINERFQGLENTVKATRTERDDFNTKLGTASKKANFYEEAYAQQCSRPQAAFALALANNHFDKDGKVNWEAIRSELPEVFKVANGNTNAGAGTQKPAVKPDANQAIRDAYNNGSRSRRTL